MNDILLVLLAASVLTACKKELGASEQAVDNAAILLSYKQPVAVLTGAAGATQLTLTDVQDSRCPINAYCIWAGYAAVTVELTDATSTLQTARLSLLNKPSPAYSLDSVAVTLNQQAYWLRLVAVSPYAANQLQRATLRLRPR